MSTDGGGIEQIAFRAEGGDETDNFWRETVDGGEAILEISRRRPNCSSSGRYLVDLEVLRVRYFVFGNEGDPVPRPLAIEKRWDCTRV